MMKLLALGAFFLISQDCLGSVLKLETGPRTIENVNVASGASADLDGSKQNFDSIGAGVRTKKVAIMNVKVYVAQLLGSNPGRFVRTEEGALGSLTEMPGVVMRLTFLRSVDAQTVESSFRDALEANRVSLSREDVRTFLSKVGAGNSVSAGSSITLVGFPQGPARAKDLLVYEDAQGRVARIEGSSGFVRALFSIWMGRPADDGLMNLKKQLLQPVAEH